MRIYKAEYVATDHADDWDEETSDTFPEPDGWAEHCMALWGEHRDFYLYILHHRFTFWAFVLY
jgi:hypothetical protein